jgi:NADPH:quinone reductase-like Zn-dependent oxidoreductase
VHAVVLDRFGPPEVLHYRQVPDPRPGPGEVVVAVRSVSVNRTLDLAVRATGGGRNPTLPLVLGADPTGVIRDIGPEVHGRTAGQRVAVRSPVPCGSCEQCRAGGGCTQARHLGVDRWGGYADLVVVPERALVDLPPGISFPEATVILRHYPTAFHLLETLGSVAPGERVLVMGAAGALGSAGVEVARLLGARVVAGVGSDRKAEVALKMGADDAINYRSRALRQAVLEVTGGAGVNVVFENIADPQLWPEAFASLARDGRLVTAGAHGGPVVPLDVRRLYRDHLRIIGGTGSDRRSVQRTLAAAAEGALHPLIGEVLPLREARRAHELAEKGEVIGKVILEPSGENS